MRDALGRVIAERDPSGVEHAYRYDGRGLLAEEQVAGDVTRHRYDAEGRLVASRTADGVETRFAYDAAGRVVEVQSPDQHLRLGYDAQDRVTSVEDVLARTTLGYAYDVRGLRSELRAPWGTTRYAYDDAGRLSELTDPAGGRYVYAYDAAGRLAERRFPNGARSVYAYDLSGRLLEVTTRDAEGAAVERCRYAYDAAGNRIEEETSAGLATFAYDDHDRLIAARYPDGRVEGYRYDATGNRVAQTLGGVEVEGAHQAQQLVTWGEEAYAHDARGGVIARETPAGTWRYAYDGRGRLARAVSPQGVETRYGYGASGLRAWKEVGGERTRFVYDFEDVVGEVDARGELVASYVHGLATDTPLAVEREGTRHYLHADGRLNVTALTDAAGQLAGRYRYAAFGETLAHEGAASPYRFGGRPLDAETGLYDHRARYYQPELGRYLTPDPAGAWGGLHAYAYVDHNPLTRVDPEGAWLNVVLGAGIGALVGGGLELATQLIENGGKLSEVRWGRVAAETAGGAVIGAATSVGAGALAGAVKGGRMAKNAGRLARAARRLKAPIARRFAGLGTKARGLVTKERLLGVAKWPLRFTWATAKGLPKKIADGTIYGIVNAVLGVLVYNRITAGTFNVLKTLRETVGDSGDEEAKPDSEQAKVIAIEARDKNLRAARDATHSRTGKVDWTVMAITGLQSRKEGLETQRLILRQSPPVDEAALARIDARIAQIDEQLVRYLDLMAWYYHQYDEIKGVTLRRMHEFGFTIERLQAGGRKGETVRVPEREDLDRNSELVGYVVGFEGREGRYLLSQQWPRTEAEAEAAAGGAAPTGDPLDGLIDPAQLPAGQR
ncbi:MAG: RHS repeat-associated core domain-containing protein [Planctomycetota bacterium]